MKERYGAELRIQRQMERENKFARREEAQERRARIYNKAAQAEMADDGTLWAIGRFSPGGRKYYNAQRAMVELGFSAYLPLGTRYQKLSRYTKSRQRKAYPEWPGWVFVGLPAGFQNWLSIYRSQSFVRGFLSPPGQSGRIKSLSGDEMASWIDSNYQTFTPDEDRATPDFTVGDEVQILEGSFEGFFVKVSELGKRDARVVTTLFGRDQEMKVSLDNLAKVL